MRFPTGLFPVFLLAAALVSAGCTQAPVPAAPAAPVPAAVAGPDLPSLALAPADLPACYALSGQRVKTAGDVGVLAKNAGWEAGFEAVFSCPATGGEPSVIVHSLALYPAANVPEISAMVDRQDRPAGYLFENTSDPDQRVFISGFMATANTTGAPESSAGSFVLSGGKDAAAAAGSAGDFAEFIVYRGNVFEVLRMTGPGTDAALLHGLAQKAASKIP
jgi:hypothetical protein